MNPVSSFRRTLIGTLLIGAVITLAVAGILGDRFGPWVDTARNAARGELESLVDQSKYRLALAEKAVEKARERCSKLREVVAQNESLIKVQERSLGQARREGDESRSGLAFIEERRKAGEVVRLRGGRELTSDELELRVLEYRQRIDQSQEKVRYLEAFVERCRVRQNQLLEQARQAPLELAKLELSLNHLAEKTRFYDEQRKLLAAEGKMAADADLCKEARQTLDKAHAELDAGLSVFDNRFPFKDDLDMSSRID